MKHSTTLTSSVMLMLAAIGAWPRAAGATEAVSGQRVNVRNVVPDDLVTAARSVRVQAEVEGDLAAAGSRVTIAAPVEGYVMSAGRTVSLQAPIGNDLWAAGQTVAVDGRIGNNAMVAGGTVHLGSESVVGHDASLMGELVTAEGRVERNLKIGAATARIGADVGGTVEASAEKVSLLPGAVVRGDFVVRSPRPPEISPQARVLGELRYQQVDERGRGVAWLVQWLFTFLSLLILGLVAVAFSPEWAARVSATMKRRFGGSLGVGLLELVLIPAVAVVLLITVIGIPLALVLLALYSLILLLAGVFVSYRIGGWLLDRLGRTQTPPWMRMALGALIVSLGISLPFVGWLIALAVLTVGAGAVALERRDQRAQLHGALA